METFGQNERDILFTMATNIKNICKKQDYFIIKLDEHIDKDFRNVPKRLWMFVTAGLSTLFLMLVIGAYTYTYKTDCKINTHSSDMVIHNIKFNGHP